MYKLYSRLSVILVVTLMCGSALRAAYAEAPQGSLADAQRKALASKKHKKIIDELESEYDTKFQEHADRLFHEAYLQAVKEGVQMYDLHRILLKMKEKDEIVYKQGVDWFNPSRDTIKPDGKYWYYGEYSRETYNQGVIFYPKGGHALTTSANQNASAFSRTGYTKYLTDSGKLSKACRLTIEISAFWSTFTIDDKKIYEKLDDLSCIDYVAGKYDSKIKHVVLEAVNDSFKPD